MFLGAAALAIVAASGVWIARENMREREVARQRIVSEADRAAAQVDATVLLS
jgi:uncharacterized membrane protein SpoIIM required for sporulation